MNENMRYVILGTAGHIDHGKTTLIKALTGRETDNLEEEKRRGISINLGFTYFDLPSGDRVGIIDVPGHERFVKNMMSGAVGIDIVLMIIAADDGVMPQTLEHAEILTYMGIKDSIIVITKSDSVDDEILELVELDIKNSLVDTILKDSPIVKVDSLSHRGLGELIQIIVEKSKNIENEKLSDMPTRMNVDRSFSLKGIGTVVTGTLIEGDIKVNQKYELFPSKKEIKIRSIEVHGKTVNQAIKGQRTALNISNLEKDEIQRGDIIASPNSLVESTIIDAKLKLSNHTDVVLNHWTRVRVFHGTKEILARVVPLETKEVKKGEETFVQLRLEEPIYCKINDPFVIRSYSPVNTIGGGTVIETISQKYNLKDIEYLKELEEKEKFNLKNVIYSYINRVDFGTSFEDILSYTGHLEEEIKKNLEDLVYENKIFAINDLYISDNFLTNLKSQIEKILKEFHKSNPLELGMTKEELREKVAKRISSKDFNFILNSEDFKKSINNDKNLVFLQSFKVNLSDENSEIVNSILNRIKEAEPNLLKDSDFSSSKIEKDAITYLLKEKLKRLDGYLITVENYEKVKKELIEFLKLNKEISLSEFRDMNNINRKISLALLEDFDKNKITKRVGEKRSLY